jgi:ubiquinone/menaquinone biosynthesis C-methylase UbiE
MSSQSTDHWEKIYASIRDDKLGWHQPQSGVSFQLITQFSKAGSGVIDIGGGSSSLAGQLLLAGFRPVTVLDIAPAALARARNRLAPSIQAQINWLNGDVLSSPDLPACDVWHDRAVFHFLTATDDKTRYAEVAERTIKPGGYLIVGTFALDGPDSCSGLPMQHYNCDSLSRVFRDAFILTLSMNETHVTPSGVEQPFVFVVMQRLPS